jgi:phenylacetate-coenzyme A ligase PaaK-like adenylate-forming protein
MRDYETLRQLHLAYALGLAPQFIERLDWSEDRLALHREERLRGLVRHAIERSPWHRERLAHVDVDRLDDDGLRALPPMTKRDLMRNFDRIVADERLSLELVDDHLQTVTTGSYLLDRYTAVTSGGSSGERGVFVYDWEGWATFWLGMGRYLVRAKQRDAELASRPIVMGWVTAAHFSHASAALARTFANADFANVRFPVTLPMEEIVAGLNQTEPDFLFAYPSVLHGLAFEARAGHLRISPRRVLSLAEPLLPEIRAVAEEAWGVGVGNLWGASEGGVVAAACEESRMHLSDDLVIIEPVDEDGRPAQPGERSAKVYLTNLFNRALPLIRYEITDEVTILAEPCPCASAHRCVADIQGRLDDVFVYGKCRVHPHVFRAALSRHPGVIEYQVRQTGRGADIAVRCGGAVDSGRLSTEIADGLHALGVPHPVIEVRVVQRLDRDPGPAKLRRFVALAGSARPPAEPALSVAR